MTCKFTGLCNLHFTILDVLDVLRKIGYAVHDIVPEKYRPTEDNKPGMFPHPVPIEFDDNGYFDFADYDPPSKTSRIVKCR